MSMHNDNKRYWSDLVHGLIPYEPGIQPAGMGYIKLNTNENPYPPSPRVSEVLSGVNSNTLRLYPDPDSSQLREKISQYYKIKPEQVFVGNGSDEVLALAFAAFFKGRSYIQFPDLTYSFYTSYCRLFSVDYKTSALNKKYEIDPDGFDENSGGIIFPNPNAPTGILLGKDKIEYLLQKHSDIPVIIDEAYIDFGGDTAISLIENYSNLVVVKTLSKSRSLAGLRIGITIGDSSLIQALITVKNSFNSYPLDRLAQLAGIAAFDDEEYFRSTITDIIKSRSKLGLELEKRSFKVLPSHANFLFVSHPVFSAKKLYEKLMSLQVLVRHFDVDRARDYLRITIGSPYEMETFISRLDAVLKNMSHDSVDHES